MWARPVNRREFADLLSARRGADVNNVFEVPDRYLDSFPRDVMIALWADHPRECGPLPSAIVVPSGGVREFLAWTATYVRDFRPFTAFCRVMERTVAEQFLAATAVPALRQAEGICAGLVLGESLAQLRGRIDLREFPVTTYPVTLSYALSRALALTGTTELADVITALWSQVRETTGQSRMALPPNAVAFVWSVAFGLAPGQHAQRSLSETGDTLREVWSELSTTGVVSERSWGTMTNGIPTFAPLRDMSRLPRERRLDLVDVALKLLIATGRDGNERWSFLAGYITSMLGPGTLDHAEILIPASLSLPTAFLWYGLFAGTNLRGDGLPVGNPVARRIVRDLTAPDRAINRPRCDIAFDELAVLLPTEVATPLLNTRAGKLDIDILPGLTMSVRWPPQDSTVEEERRKTKDAEAHHALSEMEELALRQRSLIERLREMLGINEPRRAASPKRKRTDPS